jgi:hypothetical protein
MDARQAGRCEQHLDRQLAFAEHAQLAAVRVGRADEELERLSARRRSKSTWRIRRSRSGLRSNGLSCDGEK